MSVPSRSQRIAAEVDNVWAIGELLDELLAEHPALLANQEVPLPAMAAESWHAAGYPAVEAAALGS